MFTLTLTFGVIAQDAADKKVQAGLVLGTGVNLQNSNTKAFDAKAAAANMMVGATVNIGFNNNIGLATGVEFDFDNSKFKPTAPTYYRFDDVKILRANEDSDNAKFYQLEERKQEAIYLTIPAMMIFRTNYIGYFRYYGKFGLRNSFLLTAKSNDKGSLLLEDLTLEEADNKNMKLNKGNDMLFYRGSVGLSAGAEWNFVGSTCLALEVGYFYGFTPLFYNPKEDKRTLYNIEQKNENGSIQLDTKYINNLAHQSQLLFKISVLF